MSPFLIFAGIWILTGILGLIIFMIALQADKKRRADLSQFASDLGLQYQHALDPEDEQLFSGFQLAQQGRSRKASNVIVADSGELRMILMDYQFTTGSGKNQSVRKQSVVLARSASLSLPSFSIAPENFFHRIGELLGYKDIDFDDDPRFSNQFLLHGADESAVRRFFSSERRNRFHDYPDVTVEGAGDCFLFYQPSKRWKADETKLLMEKAFAIYAILQS